MRHIILIERQRDFCSRINVHAIAHHKTEIRVTSDYIFMTDEEKLKNVLSGAELTRKARGIPFLNLVILRTKRKRNPDERRTLSFSAERWSCQAIYLL